MNTYILLLRGINVGGRNTLPMKKLVALLESLDCHKIITYIQSGNAVLQSNKTATALTNQISKEIKHRFDFKARALIISLQEFEQAITANPFPAAEAESKTLHLGFLEQVPTQPQLDKMASLATDNECFQLVGKLFYLHAPNGIGRSKLATKCEEVLGVTMTSRNWLTVVKLNEIVTNLK